jgi:hypothetical protein
VSPHDFHPGAVPGDQGDTAHDDMVRLGANGAQLDAREHDAQHLGDLGLRERSPMQRRIPPPNGS